LVGSQTLVEKSNVNSLISFSSPMASLSAIGNRGLLQVNVKCGAMYRSE
jgi:hypothetical protein